ncbi:azurin [Arcticibacter pallidicorallinus]|uniref:Azurin n=1 Tax=Arcticibacter pallidicorallinus TaxID=1259464 RepID=A0A2T0U0Q5_9SPHI|nr:azurin [Arcticibacter pallidicorallinus]PRY51485.1 azurin [Arcticibacter pallidicorallinus]
MKKNLIIACAFSLSMAACIGTDKDKEVRGSTADTGKLAVSTGKPTAAATVEIPGLDTMAANNAILLTGNDRMQYSDTLFKVKASEKIKVTFKNIGKMPKNSMGHNFVLLAQGTDFTNFATEAMKARDDDYIPKNLSSSIIAHTRLVGPGETDEISFSVPNKGIYDFLCSFPGHYGTMRGKLVAE